MSSSNPVANIVDGRLAVTRTIQIPLDEFNVEYVRSSGPGGQNVNKVSSKARMRWQVDVSPSLPDGVRERFVEEFRSRLTTGGELIISSQQFRDQKRNYADCLNRIAAMIRSVAKPPTPRKETKPTAGSQRRRMAAKRRRSEAKQLRRPPIE